MTRARAIGRQVAAHSAGDHASIIRRWPKQAFAARSTCSRSRPQLACMMLNEASLHTAPMSPRWLASRSSSAASARSHTARGGAAAPSAVLDGSGERDRVGDRAVAGDAAGEASRALERGAGHQRVDALVHVAEPLLQAHHGLAVGGEAEVARLDDAGVHRAHRDLVQALAFRGRNG